MGHILTPMVAALGGAVALFVLIAKWLLDRAAVAVDEMIRQDYQSFAERLGDAVVWWASRRTDTPEVCLEEWLEHMCEVRASTGRPALPDALQFLLVPRRMRESAPLPALIERSVVEAEPQFGDTLMDQMFDLWINPELSRRGLSLDRGLVARALVVMAPDQPPRVLLNDESQWVARLPARRAIAAGEEVTAADVDLDTLTDVRPQLDDLNAGWTGFVSVADKHWVAFDFRRNRSRAGAVLDQATADLEVATRTIRRAGAAKAAIGLLLGAAEGAVDAQNMLHEDHPATDRQARGKRFRRFAELGNVPLSHPACLERLVELVAVRRGRWWRIAGRRELRALARTTDEMIRLASSRVGPLEEVAMPAASNDR